MRGGPRGACSGDRLAGWDVASAIARSRQRTWRRRVLDRRGRRPGRPRARAAGSARRSARPASGAARSRPSSVRAGFSSGAGERLAAPTTSATVRRRSRPAPAHVFATASENRSTCSGVPVNLARRSVAGWRCRWGMCLGGTGAPCWSRGRPGRGPEPVLFRTQQARPEEVAAGLEAAVRADGHAVAHPVAEKGLVDSADRAPTALPACLIELQRVAPAPPECPPTWM